MEKRLKKVIAGLIMVMAAYSAQAACQITYTTASDVMEKHLAKNGFAARNYDALCEKLKAANARMTISASATVLSGKAISWVMVGVMDRTTTISITGFGAYSTTVNDDPSMSTANGTVGDSLTAALEDWNNIDKALASLDLARNETKSVLMKKK